MNNNKYSYKNRKTAHCIKAKREISEFMNKSSLRGVCGHKIYTDPFIHLVKLSGETNASGRGE